MKSRSDTPSFFRRLLGWCFWMCALAAVALGVWSFYAFRDRSPRYALNVLIDGRAAKAAPRPLRAGFGRVNISPDLSNPKRPVWLAGFQHNRAATGIHDDLWAVACVIDDGHTRLGIAVIDAIGFFHDDVVEVRRRLSADWKLDYTVICSTHNHTTPDLLGLWGPAYIRSGVDPLYREKVINGIAKALGEAVGTLQPARMSVQEIPVRPEGLVTDTRKPVVYDSDVRMLHFTHPATGATLGSIVGWGNHPETPWSGNTEITADFPGYLRDALEHGIRRNGKAKISGLGGTHLFVNGAVGGLMTTHPSVTVTNAVDTVVYSKPSHDKARAVGENLAKAVLDRVGTLRQTLVTNAPIQIRAKTILLPIENTGFLLAPLLHVMDRGHTGWKKMRSEVALITVGEAAIACVPGEIYPEIVNGGVERPAGGDYNIEPVEVPPIREMMPGKVKFLFGLANDEIGYIIPKSEWDTKPPFLYGAEKQPYGEINSLGPDTARLIHEALRELCAQAK